MTQKAAIAGLEKAVAAAVARLAELEKKNARLEKDLTAAKAQVKEAEAAVKSAEEASRAALAAADSESGSNAGSPSDDEVPTNEDLRRRLGELEGRLASLVEA